MCLSVYTFVNVCVYMWAKVLTQCLWDENSKQFYNICICHVTSKVMWGTMWNSPVEMGYPQEKWLSHDNMKYGWNMENIVYWKCNDIYIWLHWMKYIILYIGIYI